MASGRDEISNVRCDGGVRRSTLSTARGCDEQRSNFFPQHFGLQYGLFLRERMLCRDHGWKRVTILRKIYRPPFVACPPIASDGGRAVEAERGHFFDAPLSSCNRHHRHWRTQRGPLNMLRTLRVSSRRNANKCRSHRNLHFTPSRREREKFDPTQIERASDDVDVCIVGGGPAGLSAAIRLKQLEQEHGREVRVVVLEKASEIGVYFIILYNLGVAYLRNRRTYSVWSCP